MSEFPSYTPDSREPELPRQYSGVCPGCGGWLRSSEYDGWCHRCAAPQSYAGKCEEWAARMGWTLLLNMDGFSAEAVYVAARAAAHYGLEAIGRERRAA